MYVKSTFPWDKHMTEMELISGLTVVENLGLQGSGERGWKWGAAVKLSRASLGAVLASYKKNKKKTWKTDLVDYQFNHNWVLQSSRFLHMLSPVIIKQV